MKFEDIPDIVYHATLSIYKQSLLDGINLKRCDKFVDFGQGFYVTTNLQQAIDFAIRRSKDNNKFQTSRMKKIAQAKPLYSNPIVFEYKINKEELLKLNRLIFEGCDKNWAEFIYNNRLGIDFLHSGYHNIDKRYDFVYGCMADADISTAIVDAKNHKISFEDFCNIIEPYDRYNQDQLSFHTDRAIDCLKYHREIKVGKDG